jgi:hypothetical protein
MMALASFALAGNALATDYLHVESEAQFLRDYGHQIEQVAPGIYQMIGGPLTGKTVTIGEAGLDYDLNTQRSLLAAMPKSSPGKAEKESLIAGLEEQKTRFSRLREIASRDQEKARISTVISCIYRPVNGSPIWYSATARLIATTEFYLDSGNGTPNRHFARAGASAFADVFTPHNVPVSTSLWADASAYNGYTGQSLGSSQTGALSVGAFTGAFIYSGPAFAHKLDAHASVRGVGNCFGYVGISDRIVPHF